MQAPIYQPRQRMPGSLGVSPSEPDQTVNRAAANLNKTLGGAIDAMQAENDRTRAKTAVNDFRRTAREKFVEMKNRRGVDAHKVTEDYQKWYDEELSKREKTLGNNFQQSAFRDRANAIGQHDMDSLSVHEANEHRRAQESALAGSISTHHADIQMTPTDERIKAAENDIVNEYKTVYAGIDKTADIQKQVASVYVTAVQALSDTDPVLATKKIEQWKNKLGNAYYSLKGKVRTDFVKAKSQIAADLIMGSVPDPTKQLENARAIGDAEVRDATVSRVKSRQVEVEKAKKVQHEQFMDSVTEDIIAAGNYEDALDLAAEAEGDEHVKMINLAKSLYRGDKQVTDYVKFAEAMESIDKGEVTSTPQLVRKYRSDMTAGDFEEVLKYMQGGGNVGQVKDSEVRKLFKQYTGKDPDKKSELYHTVWNHVKENIPPGKKPTSDELRKIISEGVQEGEEIRGKWYLSDPDMSYFEAKEKGVEDKWLPDIEDKEEEELIKKEITKLNKGLKGNEKYVIDETNIRLYKKHVIDGRPYNKPEK